MYFTKTLTTIVLSLFAAGNVLAQECITRATAINVDFRVNKSSIDSCYMGAAQSLASLEELLGSLAAENLDSVSVVSYSSPEGRYKYNINLSERRVAAVSKYLNDCYPVVKDRIAAVPCGESWSAFGERVAADSLLSASVRAEVLSIINSDIDPDTKKQQLKAIDNGRLYSSFVGNYFPSMRRSTVQVVWNTPYYSALATSLEALTPPRAYRPESVDIPRFEVMPITQSKIKKTIFALKTNLLYDAATLINAEVEVPIGSRFSVAVEDVFPWWSWGPNDRKYCIQILAISAEPRWWFKRNDQRSVLSGHFAGVYGMAGKHDLQWDTSWCYQGEMWSAGVTYGYAMKLSRHLNMEFAVSVGYLSSHYRHYYPSEDYDHLYRDNYKKGTTGYFGPTKLKVSLVYPINITVNKKR